MKFDKPKFIHFRKFGFHSESDLSPRGGATVYYLPQENGALLTAAICSPKDNYNKKVGREIAKGRALKSKGMRLPMQAQNREDLYVAAYEFVTGILEHMSAQHRKMIPCLDTTEPTPPIRAMKQTMR